MSNLGKMNASEWSCVSEVLQDGVACSRLTKRPSLSQMMPQRCYACQAASTDIRVKIVFDRDPIGERIPRVGIGE